MYTEEVKQRFLDKVVVEGEQPGGCWAWMGARSTGGHGTFWYGFPKGRGAHVVAWELFEGEIPRGMVVCHRCEKPFCVNPNHLKVGTYRENLTDAFESGAQPSRSGKSSNAKRLTDIKVAEIRASNLPQRELAKIYNTSQSNISWIKRGVTHNFHST